MPYVPFQRPAQNILLGNHLEQVQYNEQLSCLRLFVAMLACGVFWD